MRIRSLRGDDRQQRTPLAGYTRAREAFGRAAERPPPKAEGPVDTSPASHETGLSRPQGIFEAFVKTCQRWRLDSHQQAVLLGHSPQSTLGTYILNGQVLSPSVDARARAARIFEISLGLGTLFDENPEVENEWLRTPRARFANTAPLEYMLEGYIDNVLAVAELVRQERGL